MQDEDIARLRAIVKEVVLELQQQRSCEMQARLELARQARERKRAERAAGLNGAAPLSSRTVRALELLQIKGEGTRQGWVTRKDWIDALMQETGGRPEAARKAIERAAHRLLAEGLIEKLGYYSFFRVCPTPEASQQSKPG